MYNNNRGRGGGQDGGGSSALHTVAPDCTAQYCKRLIQYSQEQWTRECFAQYCAVLHCTDLVQSRTMPAHCIWLYCFAQMQYRFAQLLYRCSALCYSRAPVRNSVSRCALRPVLYTVTPKQNNEIPSKTMVYRAPTQSRRKTHVKVDYALRGPETPAECR